MPRPVAAAATTLISLYVLSAFGVGIPGADYVRRVFNDGIVLAFVKGFAILVFLALSALAVLYTLSVGAKIMRREWIRNPGGFQYERQVRRGASEIEEGHKEMAALAEEVMDTNAALLAALERTNARLKEAEAAMAVLRTRSPDDAEHDQLSLGEPQ